MIILRSTLALVAASLVAGWEDFEQTCDKGYKVSEIRREGSRNGKVGGLEVVCDEVSGAADVSCEEAKPMTCRGSKEFCPANSWIGGLKGIELDSSSGALLLGPVCCSSPSVSTSRCRLKRKLNTEGAAFDSSIESNQVLGGFKCYRLYDQDKMIKDFILKPQVCSTGGGGGRSRKPSRKRSDTRNTPAPRSRSRPRPRPRPRPKPKSTRPGSETCEVCSCRCGPFTCPSGRRKFTTIHRRRKRATCQCLCDCSHKCLD